MFAGHAVRVSLMVSGQLSDPLNPNPALPVGQALSSNASFWKPDGATLHSPPGRGSPWHRTRSADRLDDAEQAVGRRPSADARAGSGPRRRRPAPAGGARRPAPDAPRPSASPTMPGRQPLAERETDLRLGRIGEHRAQVQAQRGVFELRAVDSGSRRPQLPATKCGDHRLHRVVEPPRRSPDRSQALLEADPDERLTGRDDVAVARVQVASAVVAGGLVRLAPGCSAGSARPAEDRDHGSVAQRRCPGSSRPRFRWGVQQLVAPVDVPSANTVQKSVPSVPAQRRRRFSRLRTTPTSIASMRGTQPAGGCCMCWAWRPHLYLPGSLEHETHRNQGNACWATGQARQSAHDDRLRARALSTSGGGFGNALPTWSMMP